MHPGRNSTERLTETDKMTPTAPSVELVLTRNKPWFRLVLDYRTRRGSTSGEKIRTLLGWGSRTTDVAIDVVVP